MVRRTIGKKQQDTGLRFPGLGFTIVELLIVVVTLGILSTIAIVSYNGITTRSKTTRALTNAETVYKKAVAHYNDPNGNSAYPASVATFKALPPSSLGALPSSLPLSPDYPNSATENIWYVACLKNSVAIGFIIGYWDFGAKATRFYVDGTVGYGTPTGTTNGKYSGVGCTADADATSTD